MSLMIMPSLAGLQYHSLASSSPHSVERLHRVSGAYSRLPPKLPAFTQAVQSTARESNALNKQDRRNGADVLNRLA
jgi:hypothetical protein